MPTIIPVFFMNAVISESFRKIIHTDQTDRGPSMAFDGGHSLERIFLTLSDSCPLPVGWACLRQPKDEQNILFAHVTVDDQLKVKCDRTILLSVIV